MTVTSAPVMGPAAPACASLALSIGDPKVSPAPTALSPRGIAAAAHALTGLRTTTTAALATMRVQETRFASPVRARMAQVRGIGAGLVGPMVRARLIVARIPMDRIVRATDAAMVTVGRTARIPLAVEKAPLRFQALTRRE
jgi:hypothetical protein